MGICQPKDENIEPRPSLVKEKLAMRSNFKKLKVY